MKRLLEFLYIVILGLGFVAAAEAAKSPKKSTPDKSENHGGDVYNFYFQKAPGPTTVIQGGPQGGQVVQSEEEEEAVPAPEEEVATPESEPLAPAATSQAAVTPEEPKKETFFRELYLGSARHTNAYGQFNGTGIGGTYYFNEYVGLTAELSQANRMTKDGEGYEDKERMVNRPSAVDLAAGLVINPVQIEVFGFKFLEVGLVGGFMTNEREHEGSRKRAVDGFIGPRVAINFSKQLGLTVDTRLASGDNGFGQETVSLRYKF